MIEVKNIPKLRFPQFEGTWKEKSIQELINDKSIIGHLDGNHGALYPNSNEFSDEGIPYITATDIVNNKINPNNSKKLPINRALTFKKGISKNGDLLFAHNATVGPVSILETDYDFVILSTTLTYYRLDCEKLIPQYLLNFFQCKYFVSQYSRVMSQSTRNQVPITQQRKFKVYLPKVPEQQKIADFLTAVDKRIELLEKKMTLLETYKKGVMKKIFNQEIRFKDDNGNDFPDWVSGKIQDITLRISTGLNPRKNFSLGNGDNYYVTIKNISNGKIDFSTCEKIDDEALVKIKNRSDLSRDDIIMSSIGNIGESYLLTSDPTNWNINESVFMLRPNQELIIPVFFYYILTNDNANRYFLGNMTGSSFKSIKIGDLREMPVSIPSLIEQKKISKFLKLIDNQIELLETQIDKSRTWKKGLLQKMFV